MANLDFNLTNLEQRASNPDGTEGEGLSHKTGGIGGAGMVLVQVLELAPPVDLLVDGEPRAAAIVVHDIGGHGRQYEDLAVALSRAGLIVSLPDLRGHGSSEGPRGHVPGLPEPVRDIHNVREHVAYRMPGARSVVVGVGAGALFAMEYAKQHADEVHGVVLVAPLVKPDFEIPAKGKGLLGRFKKPAPTDGMPLGWSADMLRSDAGAQQAWSSDSKRNDELTVRAAEVIQAAAQSAVAGYKALGKPTLVLAGADDPLAKPADLEALAQELGAEYECFPGMRHDLFGDAGSEAVIARTVAFCD